MKRPFRKIFISINYICRFQPAPSTHFLLWSFLYQWRIIWCALSLHSRTCQMSSIDWIGELRHVSVKQLTPFTLYLISVFRSLYFVMSIVQWEEYTPLASYIVTTRWSLFRTIWLCNLCPVAKRKFFKDYEQHCLFI